MDLPSLFLVDTVLTETTWFAIAPTTVLVPTMSPSLVQHFECLRNGTGNTFRISWDGLNGSLVWLEDMRTSIDWKSNRLHDLHFNICGDRGRLQIIYGLIQHVWYEELVGFYIIWLGS